MNAEIVVNRIDYQPDWTLSKFSVLEKERGVGVEDEKRDKKVHGETCIAAGIYELDLRYSPKFSKSYFVDATGNLSPTKSTRFATEHLMIWVKGVPNFEFVLWHWGNTDDDTEGCYIVGSTFATFGAQKGVGGSRVKYVEVYPDIFNLIMKNKAAGKKTYIEYK